MLSTLPGQPSYLRDFVEDGWGWGHQGRWRAAGLLLCCSFIDHVTLPGLTPLSSSVNTYGGKTCQQAHKNYVAGLGNTKSSMVHLLFPPIATERGQRILTAKLALQVLWQAQDGCCLRSCRFNKLPGDSSTCSCLSTTVLSPSSWMLSKYLLHKDLFAP